jgi:hypothetical protein
MTVDELREELKDIAGDTEVLVHNLSKLDYEVLLEKMLVACKQGKGINVKGKGTAILFVTSTNKHVVIFAEKVEDEGEI